MPALNTTSNQTSPFWDHNKRRKSLLRSIERQHKKTQRVLRKSATKPSLTTKCNKDKRPTSAPASNHSLYLNLNEQRPERPRYRNQKDQPFFKTKQQHDTASKKEKETGWNTDTFFKTKADGTWINNGKKKVHSARF
jgi:hypothetical protein